jgi:hypothetical protein
MARTVYHLFKYRIYRMYINHIKPYSVYMEKSVPFKFKSQWAHFVALKELHTYFQLSCAQ